MTKNQKTSKKCAESWALANSSFAAVGSHGVDWRTTRFRLRRSSNGFALVYRGGLALRKGLICFS